MIKCEKNPQSAKRAGSKLKMDDPAPTLDEPPDFGAYEGQEAFYISDAHILTFALIAASAVLVPIASALLSVVARRLSRPRCVRPH